MGACANTNVPSNTTGTTAKTNSGTASQPTAVNSFDGKKNANSTHGNTDVARRTIDAVAALSADVAAASCSMTKRVADDMGG